MRTLPQEAADHPDLLEIRQEGHYYVDKTPQILQLIDQAEVLPLPEPGRASAKPADRHDCRVVREGNRPLFEGLHAERHWDWSRRFPCCASALPHKLQPGRTRPAHHPAAAGQLIRPSGTASAAGTGYIAGLLGQLIRRAQVASGQRIWVLVDEYDKPILTTSLSLRWHVQCAKGCATCIQCRKGRTRISQFAMLTGVSKFSKGVAVLGLNNLRDITVSADYSALCGGYTDEDIDNWVRARSCWDFDRDEIRRWYNPTLATGPERASTTPSICCCCSRSGEFKSCLVRDRHADLPG